MPSTIIFDIETIPDIEGLKNLGFGVNETEEDAIVTSYNEERKRQTEFLPLHLHRVIAISYVSRRKNLQVGSIGDSNSSEADLIHRFYEIIDKYTPNLVSWNGNGFDLQVLQYRGLIHKIPATKYWWTDGDFKWNSYTNRYHKRHTDLMDVLSLYNGRGYVPMDEFAKLCGFPGKLSMDGSQVFSTYQKGKIDEIRAYCEIDCMNTYLLYLRFQLMRGELSEDAYFGEMKLVAETLSERPETHWKEFMSAWVTDKNV